MVWSMDLGDKQKKTPHLQAKCLYIDGNRKGVNSLKRTSLFQNPDLVYFKARNKYFTYIDVFRGQNLWYLKSLTSLWHWFNLHKITSFWIWYKFPTTIIHFVNNWKSEYENIEIWKYLKFKDWCQWKANCHNQNTTSTHLWWKLNLTQMLLCISWIWLYTISPHQTGASLTALIQW